MKKYIDNEYDLKEFLVANKTQLLNLISKKYKSEDKFQALLLSMLNVLIQKRTSVVIGETTLTEEKAESILKNFLKTKNGNLNYATKKSVQNNKTK